MKKQQFSDHLDALIAIGNTYDPFFMTPEEHKTILDDDGKLVFILTLA